MKLLVTVQAVRQFIVECNATSPEMAKEMLVHASDEWFSLHAVPIATLDHDVTEMEEIE